MKKSKVVNIYAKDIKGNPVHAGEVARGRKGYYCLGCDKEMEARKGEVRAPYFAHISGAAQTEKKCTYSDETYRHKLAKEILQRTKTIKVPNLYKYPPPRIDGLANKLDEAKFINATYVKNEVQFYENEKGEIRFGRNIDFEKSSQKHLLIQPDVTFFDEDKTPILFIEIVATHKVDKDKLLKLKRLGIDTIQVSIPKDSPERIENTFKNTSRTEWLFNYEQEKAKYIFLPQTHGQGILPISEFRKKLLRTTESFECRSSQIKDLIRRIKQCLESEPYLSVGRNFNSEISRVKRNTEEHQGRLIELREKANRSAIEATKHEREKLKSEEAEFSTEENRFTIESEDLEQRYLHKRDSLQAGINNIEQKIKEAEIYLKTRFQKKVQLIKEGIEARREGTGNFRCQIERLDNEEREVVKNLSNKIREIDREQDTIRTRRESLQKQYDGIEAEIIRDFNRKRGELESRIRKIIKEFEKEESEYRRQVSEAVKGRDCEGTASIHGRIQGILNKQRILFNISKERDTYTEMGIVKKILDSGNFKEWL